MKKVVLNCFAACLRQLRTQNKISQAKLAVSIGYSQREISNWEKGVNAPIEALWKIADYFGVTTDFLIGRTE